MIVIKLSSISFSFCKIQRNTDFIHEEIQIKFQKQHFGTNFYSILKTFKCNKVRLFTILSHNFHVYLQPMDYEGFKLFMSAYLGNNVSEDLCEHLFWAFHKQVAVHSPSLSQTIIDSVAVSVVASNSQQDINKHDQRRREYTWDAWCFGLCYSW